MRGSGFVAAALAVWALAGCDQVFGLDRPDDQAPEPIGRWRFDEPSGSVAADDSAMPHAAAVAGSPERIEGVIGLALRGDGVDDYVRIDGLDLGATAAVTVSLWVRVDATSGLATLFESSENFNASETGFGMFVDPGSCPLDNFAGELRGDVGYTKHCYDAAVLGAWRHMVTIFDKSRPGTDSINLYVDGVLQPNRPSMPVDEHTNTGTFGLNPLFLLTRFSSMINLPAAIDDLQVFDRALTHDQILALLAQGT